MNKGLLAEAEMTERQLCHQGVPQHGDSSQNLVNLAHAAQSTGSRTGGMSFPGVLVETSPRQLGWILLLLGSCLKTFLSLRGRDSELFFSYSGREGA